MQHTYMIGSACAVSTLNNLTRSCICTVRIDFIHSQMFTADTCNSQIMHVANTILN